MPTTALTLQLSVKRARAGDAEDHPVVHGAEHEVHVPGPPHLEDGVTKAGVIPWGRPLHSVLASGRSSTEVFEPRPVKGDVAQALR